MGIGSWRENYLALPVDERQKNKVGGHSLTLQLDTHRSGISAEVARRGERADRGGRKRVEEMTAMPGQNSAGDIAILRSAEGCRHTTTRPTCQRREANIGDGHRLLRLGVEFQWAIVKPQGICLHAWGKACPMQVDREAAKVITHVGDRRERSG